MLSALVGLLVVGIVAVVVLGAVLAVFGMVFGLLFAALALAFKLLPLVLVGWLVVKLIQRAEGGSHRSRLSTADRRWLDT